MKKMFLLIEILLLTANVILWGSQKEGFHVDEMFSYEQVGNTMYPKPEYDRPKEPCMNAWHSRTYYEDYLTIDASEAYDFSSFYSSASMNTAHPPLYLTLFGMYISAFFQNNFTKWSGISLNLIFYVSTLVLIYDLSKRVLKKEGLAFFCVFLYGISVGAVSTVMFIRVYMMLTFFSTAFIDLHVRMMEKKLGRRAPLFKRLPLYLSIICVLVFGALSQYYFLVFAFFVCMGYFFFLVFLKQYKRVVEYTLSIITGLAIYYSIWPNIIRDLFYGDRGKEAIGNLTNAGDLYIAQLAHLIYDTDNRITGGVMRLLLAVLIALLLWKLWKVYSPHYVLNDNGIIELKYSVRPWDIANNTQKSVTVEIQWLMFFVVFFSSVCYLLMIAKIAPVLAFDRYKDPRYIFNVFPCFMLSIIFFLDKASPRLCSLQIWKKGIWPLLALSVLLGYYTNGVEYLYKGASNQLDILAKYSDDRAVFVTEMPYFCSNLNVYFTSAEAVYPTNQQGLSLLPSVFEELDEDEILVYVSIDTENIFQVIQTIYTELNAKECTYLFDTVGRHETQVYLLKL